MYICSVRLCNIAICLDLSFCMDYIVIAMTVVEKGFNLIGKGGGDMLFNAIITGQGRGVLLILKHINIFVRFFFL